MLRRIRVQNFLSLRDATVDLSPLTVFVGPNASGKSAVFKALVTVSRLLGGTPVQGPKGEFRLEPGVTLDHIVWNGNSGLPIEFSLWWSEDTEDQPGYTLELRKEARGWSVSRERIKLGDKWLDTSEEAFEHETERLPTRRWRAPYRATLCHLVWPFRNDQAAAPAIGPLLAFGARFGEARRYRIGSTSLAAFASPPENPTKVQVNETGWALPLVLQQLQGKDRRLFEAIEQELSRIFPHIRLINFQSERFGVGLAFTTNRSEDLVPASQESDGVLLTTFLLWRLFTGSPSFKLCFEEPENGVHPYLLGDRYRLLRRFARSDQGPQLLIATHSPDFVSSIEDQQEILDVMRIVEFGRGEGTKVHRLAKSPDLELLLSTFGNNLGDLWWSGAIGAVPSTNR